MKPITVDNVDGRTLLALRAGPMTAGELSARNGSGVAGWLIKAGYITQDGSFYRITEAGRAACPYRNPLAAPGVVPPATYKPEIDISRETVVTRQQVLAVIKEAGAAGISKQDLVAKFEHLVPENAITSHLVMLKKDGAVANPSRGTWVATSATKPVSAVATPAQSKQQHATREAVMAWLEKQPEGYGGIPHAIAQDIGCSEESTSTVLAGLYGALKIERAKVGEDWAYFLDRTDEDKPAITPSPETPSKIALKSPLTVGSAPAITAPASAYPAEEIILPGGELAIPSRAQIAELIAMPGSLQPTVVEDVMLDDPEIVEFAIFSSGGMDIYCAESTVSLNKAVLGKLRAFLGLFQEAA